MVNIGTVTNVRVLTLDVNTIRVDMVEYNELALLLVRPSEKWLAIKAYLHDTLLPVRVLRSGQGFHDVQLESDEQRCNVNH